MRLWTRIERLNALCDASDAAGAISQNEAGGLKDLARRLQSGGLSAFGIAAQFLNFAIHPRVYAVIDGETRRAWNQPALLCLEQRTLRAMAESDYDYGPEVRRWLDEWLTRHTAETSATCLDAQN